MSIPLLISLKIIPYILFVHHRNFFPSQQVYDFHGYSIVCVAVSQLICLSHNYLAFFSQIKDFDLGRDKSHACPLSLVPCCHYDFRC